MAFTEAEKTGIRRFCGYPAYGAGAAGFQVWRFCQASGLLEYRMNNLSDSEEVVVRRYLATLSSLEFGVTNAANNLDTDKAAVWSRNSNEVQDRTRLFDDWRRRLCGFFGVPPGDASANSGITLVV